MHHPENQIELSAEREVPPVRMYVDPEGTRWRVFEQAFSDYDRRRGSSLIFAAETAVRRVREYPSNWYELTDPELVALSWNV